LTINKIEGTRRKRIKAKFGFPTIARKKQSANPEKKEL
jgi:hypothetical protein